MGKGKRREGRMEGRGTGKGEKMARKVEGTKGEEKRGGERTRKNK